MSETNVESKPSGYVIADSREEAVRKLERGEVEELNQPEQPVPAPDDDTPEDEDEDDPNISLLWAVVLILVAVALVIWIAARV